MTLTPEQLECLASPACSSVFRALRALGRASANEIASKVERSAATVIYHLRRLEDSGLIAVVERRAARRKPEAVYEPASAAFELPEGDEMRDLRVRAVQAGLRHAMRGWEKASRIDSGSMQVIQAQIRLKPDDQAKFEAMIEEASRFAKEHESEEGVLHHWSSVVYPES